MNLADDKNYFGVIADQPQETDNQLVSGVFTLPQAPHKFLDNKIQYNQKDIQANSCTLHGAMGALSDLTAHTFTLDERKEIYQRALKEGFSPQWGWYTSKAVSLLASYWNEKHPNEKVTFFRMDLGSSEFEEALSKNYSVVFAYNGNGNYEKDFLHDGRLDETALSGASTFAHCIRVSRLPDSDTAIDNYFPDQKPNIYVLPDKNIKALLANKVLQFSGYIFVFENDFNNHNPTMPEIPTWALASVNKAVNKGLMHPADFRNPMTIGTIEDSLVKLGIFNNKLGTIDAERWAVALDRMHALN